RNNGSFVALAVHGAAPSRERDTLLASRLLQARTTAMKLRSAFLAAAILVWAVPASAGPIAVNTWYEFFFDISGVPVVTGCFPNDPAGGFCLPSSGTPTTEANAPAWTFTAAATGATFTVTDAFASGDVFQILDFGAPLGLTSVPVAGADCGDDPVPCLANPNMSHRAFALAPGNHSITIALTAGDVGAAYFLLQSE